MIVINDTEISLSIYFYNICKMYCRYIIVVLDGVSVVLKDVNIFKGSLSLSNNSTDKDGPTD